MRAVVASLFFLLTLPAVGAAQNIQTVPCNGVVDCAQAMVTLTNRLAAENAALKQRLSEIERKLGSINAGNDRGMRRGAVRVEGASRGYRETTIIFNPPFRTPPLVFLSARDVNIRDHQQLWVKSISSDRAVVSNCRRHNNPEKCSGYADDFHFDWIAVRRR